MWSNFLIRSIIMHTHTQLVSFNYRDYPGAQPMIELSTRGQRRSEYGNQKVR